MMVSVTFEIFVSETHEKVLHRVVHSEKEVDKIASDIMNYKVQVVTDALYSRLKGAYKKEELGRLVRDILFDIGTDVMRLKGIVKESKKIERKYKDYPVKRKIYVKYEYWFTEGITLAPGFSLLSRFGLIGRKAVFVSPAFDPDEVRAIERSYGKVVITAEGDGVVIINYYDPVYDTTYAYADYLNGDIHIIER